MAVSFTEATDTQLLTIAYHEPCTQAEKLLALMELKRREKQPASHQVQARIKRKRG